MYKRQNSGSEFSLEEDEPNFQWSPSVFADFCRELHLSKKMSQKCLKMLKTHSCMKSSLKDVTTRVVHNRSSNLHKFFRPVVALPIKGLLSFLKVEYFPVLCDLKVLNYLAGLKSGYAKYPCFFCLFDSRDSFIDFDINHNCPLRTN